MNAGLAVCGGLLAAFAFPNPLYPGYDWQGGWLAFLCLVPLFWIRERRPAACLRWGFLFGIVYFGIATFWMAGMPALGGIAAGVWLLLTSYLALYPALFLWSYHILIRRGVPGWSVAAPLWVVLEFVRNYLFGGFPWVALGYAHYQNSLLMSLLPFTGVWGLSLVTVLVNAGLHALSRFALRPAPIPGASKRAVAWSLLLAGMVAGAWLEQGTLRKYPGARDLTVAALQGNIDQNQIWDQAYRGRVMKRFQTLGAEAVQAGARVLIWPESAFPGIYNWDADLAWQVENWSRQWRAAQMVGSDTAERDAGGGWRYYNAALLLDETGRLADSTAKIHLVPFGEYVPFKDTALFFLRKIVNRYGAGNFTPGQRRKPLQCRLQGAPVSLGPLICFESLFPQYAAQLSAQGSEFLVVITVDTWFGETAAPAQHALFSAMRAAENGRFLVRAAATGISCIFDPRGKLLAGLPLNRSGQIAARIRLRSLPTFFTRHGPWLAWLCLAWLITEVGIFLFPRSSPGLPGSRPLC